MLWRYWFARLPAAIAPLLLAAGVVAVRASDPTDTAGAAQPDDIPSAVSPDNAPAAVSPDDAPAAVSPDDAPAAVSPDNAPAAVSPDAAAATNSPDDAPAAVSPDDADFFERQIRPLLASACFKCHAKGADSEGGLRLDSRPHLLEGGYRGAAIVPGRPDESLLIAAIRRSDDDLAMPPDEPLTPHEIEQLEAWVARGAPWPEHRADRASLVAEGRQWWAFQPLVERPLPEVDERHWCTSPIDRFILARLEAAGLAPAAPADKYALLRRLTFDLTGLPPTPEEIAAFVADDAPDAVARVVDRLLASPQYGERWARHWLDLARYAETNGFELDTPKPNAARFRDWVIEAFNDDLPYDQFVREQIAGDLLDPPRESRDGATLASPQGTGFLWLGAMIDDPADYSGAKATEVEDRVAAVSQAFLGLTLACARCHDHKFDPLTMDDYYHLAGYITRSRPAQRSVDSPQRQQETERLVAAIDQVRGELAAWRQSPQVQRALDAHRQTVAARTSTYLRAARDLLYGDGADSGTDQHAGDDRHAAGEQPAAADSLSEATSAGPIARVALTRGLDPERLGRWLAVLGSAEEHRDPLFYTWAVLARHHSDSRLPGVRHRRVVEHLRSRLEDQRAADDEFRGTASVIVYDDFETEVPGRWQVEGSAFAGGSVLVADSGAWGSAAGRSVSSWRGSDAHVGRMISAPLRVEHRYLTLRIASGSTGNGPDGRSAVGSRAGDDDSMPEKASSRRPSTAVNVLLSNPALPDPEELSLTGDGTGRWIRRTLDLQFLQNIDIRIELVDDDRGGFLAVDEIVFSDEPPPPEPAATSGVLAQLRTDEAAESLEAVEQLYERLLLAALGDADAAATAGNDQTALESLSGDDAAQILDWARRGDSPWEPTDEEWLALVGADEAARRTALLAELARLEAALPASSIALVAEEGLPTNAALHLAAFPTGYADPPRGYIDVIGPSPRSSSESARGAAAGDVHPGDAPPGETSPGETPPGETSGGRPLGEATGEVAPGAGGSGRLLLAEWLTSSAQHLTARVIVNRVWQHHFGAGLVPTPDNFGRMGEPPTHPELLDYLATRLVDSGWSIKSLHRLLLLSSTYQQGSQPRESTTRERDPHNHLLAAMPVRRLEAEAIRDAMLAVAGRLDARRPEQPGGPLERSIYLELRRNELPDFLTAFDFPTPQTTVGRRRASIVPAGTLLLMNHPLVHQLAHDWAGQLLADDSRAEDRIRAIYLAALGRPPSAENMAATLEFVAAQEARYRRLGPTWHAAMAGSNASSPAGARDSMLPNAGGRSATAESLVHAKRGSGAKGAAGAEQIAEADWATRAAWADLCHAVFNLREFIFVH